MPHDTLRFNMSISTTFIYITQISRRTVYRDFCCPNVWPQKIEEIITNSNLKLWYYSEFDSQHIDIPRLYIYLCMYVEVCVLHDKPLKMATMVEVQSELRSRRCRCRSLSVLSIFGFCATLPSAVSRRVNIASQSVSPSRGMCQNEVRLLISPVHQLSGQSDIASDKWYHDWHARISTVSHTFTLPLYPRLLYLTL